MKPPASFSALGSEFDAFLFAAIGEDRNGMPLSVVSALARMDLDPWHEAASLAGVPVETATGKLIALLAALPDPSLKRLDPGTTAARLIALLPQRLDSNTRPSAAGVGTVVATHPLTRMKVTLLAIYMILMLSAQLVLMRRPPPTHADTASHALVLPATASPAPPTTSDK
jgi:hypothetical protein